MCGDADACEKWIWHQDLSKMPQEDNKKIISKVIEILVVTTFETHVYAWGGKIFMQSKWCPIGVRASGTVAKVAMEKWIQALEAALVEGGLKVHLLLKYVDDVLVAMETVQLGARWLDGKLVYTKEALEDDRKEGRTRKEVTWKILAEVANSISYLNFTGEYSDGKRRIPVLDTPETVGTKHLV